MPENAKLDENVECPSCHKVDRPLILDRVPEILHVPERYLLKCVHCEIPFYRKVPDA